MRTNLIDFLADLGAYLVLVAMALLVIPAALFSATSTPRPDAATLPTLAAHSTDTAQADATAEGTDVLPLSFHDAPPALWNALREDLPGAYDDDVPGIGTFYVPVGMSIPVPGGLALATVDGWMGCQDFETFDGECFATGPVEPTNIPVRTATSVYDYMTNGTTAQCGTDAQCAALDADRAQAMLAIDQESAAAVETLTVVNVAHTTDQRGRILAEDGSLVARSFYDRVAGPSQAVCDHLGKRRVADPVYGHRCV